jgi:hypothetical protein
MIGFNLYRQPDSVRKNPAPPFYGDVPEEELRLASYLMQARIYLITHHAMIKSKYANSVRLRPSHDHADSEKFQRKKSATGGFIETDE